MNQTRNPLINNLLCYLIALAVVFVIGLVIFLIAGNPQ